MTPPSASFAGITLLGLGPGSPALLTRQAWDWLQTIPEVYIRTRQHPTVQGFPAALQVISFDELYENSAKFEEVYAQIVERVLELGRRPQGVTYAVPGHPFVAEATCPEIARRAKAEGIPIKVIEGISFLEPTYTALGLDPFPQMALVDALDLANAHIPSFPTTQPALIAQIYSRQVASEVKLTLNAFYPDKHPVRMVHAAGTPAEVVESLSLYEIDRSEHIGLLTALYLPPLAADSSLESLAEIVAHLRAPEGCPWDREQTLKSLMPSLVEEAYEAMDALNSDEMDGVKEELGDVLMVAIMLAQIASEEGDFNLVDVTEGIARKLVFRHPHVFGDVQVGDSAEVLKNWETLKDQERKAKGKKDKPKGMFDSLPKMLPALSLAQEYQDRAAHVGFDWQKIEDVRAKVMEEWQEVADAPSLDEQHKELGDLLLAVVNLIRWYKGDAETVLRGANLRFKQRFAHIEQAARDQERPLGEFSMDEMESLWQEAKRIERGE